MCVCVGGVVCGLVDGGHLSQTDNLCDFLYASLYNKAIPNRARI